MSSDVFYKAAKIMTKASQINVPMNRAFAEILEIYMTEEQADFVSKFKPKKSYTFKELKSKIALDDNSLNKILESCMEIAVINCSTDKNTGVINYQVTPMLPGLLEIMFMKDEVGEKERKIADLKIGKFFNSMIKYTQKNYDKIVPLMESNQPTLLRTVPVEEEIDHIQEVVLPFQEVSKIINNTDCIGVGNCFCRVAQELLNDPCKRTDLKRTCMLFGDMANFLISQNFIEKITKERAMEILSDCEEAGLVHKAVHEENDPTNEITAICNCCDCCCGNISLHHKGASGFSDITSYLAKVNEEDCVGCGTCVEKCNIHAIELIEDKSTIDESKCMGCGICVHHCTANAMKLIKTELRRVFIPPPRLKNI